MARDNKRPRVNRWEAPMDADRLGRYCYTMVGNVEYKLRLLKTKAKKTQRKQKKNLKPTKNTKDFIAMYLHVNISPLTTDCGPYNL